MTRRERVSRIVVGVLRQALADSGAGALILLDDDSPEARLAREWCAAAAADRFAAVERGAHGAGGWSGPNVSVRADLSFAERELDRERVLVDDAVLEEESRRLAARIQAASTPAGALLAHPINKTALLLSPAAPPEPLLPLGDLWATDVRELAGDCSLPAPVRALAQEVGGIDALDAVLRAWFDERRTLPEALAPLPEPARARVQAALAAARFARRHVGLVPKLGPRTPGIDLFA